MTGPDPLGEERMQDKVTIRLQGEDLADLEYLVEEHYPNQSVAIRESIRAQASRLSE